MKKSFEEILNIKISKKKALLILFGISILTTLLLFIIIFSAFDKVKNQNETELDSQSESVDITTTIQTSQGETITEQTIVLDITQPAGIEEETTTSVYSSISEGSTTIAWEEIKGQDYNADKLHMDIESIPDKAIIALGSGFNNLKKEIYNYVFTNKKLSQATEVKYIKDSLKVKKKDVTLKMQLNDKKKTKLQVKYNTKSCVYKIVKINK